MNTNLSPERAAGFEITFLLTVVEVLYLAVAVAFIYYFRVQRHKGPPLSVHIAVTISPALHALIVFLFVFSCSVCSIK